MSSGSIGGATLGDFTVAYARFIPKLVSRMRFDVGGGEDDRQPS